MKRLHMTSRCVAHLLLAALVLAAEGCVDVTSLPDVQIIQTNHIAALLTRYRCPAENFAIWNGADGNSVIIRTSVAYNGNDMLVLHRDSPEPTIYRSVPDHFPDLPIPAGHGGIDQTGAVAAIQTQNGEASLTKIIDVSDGDRVISTLDSIGTPSVFVRGDRVFLVAYLRQKPEVVILDRTSGRLLHRWPLPNTAEYDADRMDLSGRHMILVCRPLPVTPYLVVLDTTTGDIRKLQAPHPDRQRFVFLSGDWFIRDMMSAQSTL